MTSVNPINATSQTALQLFQRVGTTSTISASWLAVPTGSNLLELGGNPFSPRTSEALTKIAELASVDPSRIAPTEARKVVNESRTYYETALMSREDLPESIRDRIDPAAGYTLMTFEDVSDEEFQKMVLASLKELRPDDASLQQALKDGTVTIQRPEDVEGLTGWETYYVRHYNSEGYVSGLTYFGGHAATSDLVKQRRAEGFGQAISAVNNLDYYAYWPGQDMEA